MRTGARTVERPVSRRFTVSSKSPTAVQGIEKTLIQCSVCIHLKLEPVRLHPDWSAHVHSSHQKYGINGDGLDSYATLAKVRATMVGIATDPRGDANKNN